MALFSRIRNRIRFAKRNECVRAIRKTMANSFRGQNQHQITCLAGSDATITKRPEVDNMTLAGWIKQHRAKVARELRVITRTLYGLHD